MAKAQKNSITSIRPTRDYPNSDLTIVIMIPEDEDSLIVCEDLLELLLIQSKGLTQHLETLVQGTDTSDRDYRNRLLLKRVR